MIAVRDTKVTLEVVRSHEGYIYIFKVEQVTFATGVDVGYKRNRGVKDD